MPHASFVEWAKRPTNGSPEGRPSFWTANNNLYQFSDHFRKIMRPIFFKAYQCIRQDKPSYKFPNLRCLVEVRDGITHVPNPPDQRIGKPEDIHQIIRDLRFFVEFVISKENPHPNQLLTSFRTLCANALRCRNMESLRNYAYFITLNPLIYDLDEWYSFVGKSWYYYKVNPPYFRAKINMQKLTEFPRSILVNGPFKDVYDNGCYSRDDVVRYVGNLRRHFDPEVSEHQMMLEIQRFLPGYVPILFEGLVLKFGVVNRSSACPIFGKSLRLKNWKSLISRMSDKPYIIRPNDKELVESEIRM